ncbi:ABC transporter permease [Xanthomonas sp. SHU 199]|uniref:ABC transporter permease n=1 Tax=Xanthomonas sp. SHU 199 TaxID=1591174 RepID=UPI00037C0C37|nr:FtsX-like permease family protein [Xanthomonas sp. SHU 199]
MRQLAPILAALKKHKAGTILIALQIALTLAVICNALCIIQHRIERIYRPTGLAEHELLTIQSDRVGVAPKDIPPLIDADLMALRRLPGVADATESNSFPLGGDSWPEGVRLDPNARERMARTELYFIDDHGLSTMGARLIAGRNFHPSEIQTGDEHDFAWPGQVIITKALADKVFPDGSALGKAIYLGNTDPTPSTVIGVVDHLQASWSGADSYGYMDNATLLPMRLTRSNSTYLVRAKPGQLDQVMRSAPATLVKLDRMRVFPAERGVRTFATVRQQVYKSDRGTAYLMGAISLVLLGVTAAGIVGLTSFWVGQRRKQIGVRRALGATQRDIVNYFLTENLLIGTIGVVLGSMLAIGLNVWLMSSFELTRLSPLYILAGMVVLLLLGQGAVLAPALRASRVPPAEATRST